MFAAKLRELVLQNKINSVVEFLFFFLNPLLFFLKKANVWSPPLLVLSFRKCPWSLKALWGEKATQITFARIVASI